MFASCWEKIGRADVHINALDADMVEWKNAEPYLATKEHDAEGRRHSIVLHVKNKPRIERWALMTGDAIHNLRSALDHVLYAAACHESKKSPPPKGNSIQFPIVNNSDDFPDAAERRLGPLFNTKFHSAVESVQPYNRPHFECPPLLGLLRDFDNSDKHRLLNVVMAQLFEGKFSFYPVEPNFGVPVRDSFGARLGGVEDGAELAWFIMDPPQFNIKYTYELTIVIAIRHPPGRSKRGFTQLVPLLRFIREEVIFAVNKIGKVL